MEERRRAQARIKRDTTPTVAGSDQLVRSHPHAEHRNIDAAEDKHDQRPEDAQRRDRERATAAAREAGETSEGRSRLADYKMLLLEPTFRSCICAGLPAPNPAGGVRRLAEAENSRTG